MEAAPAVMGAQQQMAQQQAQARIAEIESNAQLAAMAAQRQHEMDMLNIQLSRMESESSIPPQAIVMPGASGPPAMHISVPGGGGTFSPASAPARGPMDQGTMIALGAGALALAVMVSRK